MDKTHWAALAAWAGVGGKTMTALLQHFGSLEAILAASARELRDVRGVGPQTAAAITRLDLAAVEAELARFAAQGIGILTWEDKDYPANLLHSADAPPVLFVRGALAPQDARAVAIIGTRTPPPASAALAERIAAALAARGWTIVSGLALGIDTAAHRGALNVGGRTLAVLGCGAAMVYPPANRQLAETITQQGALLSETHPLATVSRQSLIARNRITSGLSRAVIVIQAGGKDSGSMSTVRRAREQGRPVFAFSGDADYKGLLQAGAEILTPADLDGDALAERLDRLTIVSPPRFQ